MIDEIKCAGILTTTKTLSSVFPYFLSFGLQTGSDSKAIVYVQWSVKHIQSMFWWNRSINQSFHFMFVFIVLCICILYCDMYVLILRIVQVHYEIEHPGISERLMNKSLPFQNVTRINCVILEKWLWYISIWIDLLLSILEYLPLNFWYTLGIKIYSFRSSITFFKKIQVIFHFVG